MRTTRIWNGQMPLVHAAGGALVQSATTGAIPARVTQVLGTNKGKRPQPFATRASSAAADLISGGQQ